MPPHTVRGQGSEPPSDVHDGALTPSGAMPRDAGANATTVTVGRASVLHRPEVRRGRNLAI